ncbi:MAG: DUF4294 domain-containing protein [Rikenellaceae bacterium]
MKLIHQLILILLCSATIFPSLGASSHALTDDDVVGNIRFKPIVVYAKGIDQRKYWRLVRAVKRVYPLAKTAQEKLRDMEDHIETLSKKSEKRAYVRLVYDQIKAEYTPVLKKMTITDGRVLIRLIDRETDYTAYGILDEFKGGLTATFWQGVGRIFGHNLKDEYGTNDEDRMIEMIIQYYEAGLI